ncbi:MAG: hypothetical protein Q9182_001679 [Xanthomendoza sp. 2 TL-2023]
MKERITFVHAPDSDFHPKQLNVRTDSIRVEALKAAREEQLRFPLQELPQEISQVLRQCRELHLKWASAVPYLSAAPFLSRISPGLHILFSPKPNRSVDLVAPLLGKTFGSSNLLVLDKISPIHLCNASTSRLSAPVYQYHEFLPSLKDFVIYVQEKACGKGDYQCSSAATRLENAVYLDIDYEAASRELILTSFYHEPPGLGLWNEKIQRRPRSVKTEVGVFTPEEATDRNEISLGGFSSIIGEDAKLKPTRFSFPSRHHVLRATSNSSFHATFPTPTGLHPTFRLTFPSSISPPSPQCALHTYLTLPSPLFVDKYQLSSPNFLASKNLHAIRALEGETDLEAPDWVIRSWGSTLLLELAPPTTKHVPSKTVGEQWHADIPLQLRYLPPAAGGGSGINVVWPVVFWACAAGDEEMKFDGNPFDRVNLGYEGRFFGPPTVFYHVLTVAEGEGGRLVERVMVPVMDLEGTRWIESATVGAIVLGAFWVFWRLLRLCLREAWEKKERRVEKKMQ